MALSTQIATDQDVPFLSEFINSAYRGDTSRLGWTTEADLLDGQRTDVQSLKDLISNTNQKLLLFREQDVMVGTVFLQRREHCAHLGMLTIRPDLQSRGLGKSILQIAEDWIQTHWKLNHIEMRVIQKREELIAWYERRGYKTTDRREAFPIHDPKFGIPKVLDLEFVVLEKKLS